MIVIFISSGNRGQRLGSSFSPFSPLPLYFAVLSLLRLLLCVFCQVLILFMTLSCVPTVKTPDKTSVSATKSAGSLLHLPLTRERQAVASVAPDVLPGPRCAAEAQGFTDSTCRILADTLGWRRGSCRALSGTAWLPKCR